ncbi:hypothetical protein ACH42_00860 [Endozoicomonas sp. (ex Bugula neritina AB1)]|nr:hypothetical protein ACH42_00860 [Endozoicomonas sp. (ex Bugula neritina AB1)]
MRQVLLSEVKCYIKQRIGNIFVVLFVLFFGCSHTVAAPEDSDDNPHRSNILACLQLIVESHEAIIWAILQLEKHQNVHYQEDWFYTMLMSKPARTQQNLQRFYILKQAAFKSAEVSDLSAHPITPTQDPPHLTSGNKRSSRTRGEGYGEGKSELDGYLIADSCIQTSIDQLSKASDFGRELGDSLTEPVHCTSTGREGREKDFSEIKFRVLSGEPPYRFGLKDGMICNVYEHVRGKKGVERRVWFELCVPYIKMPDASLYHMGRGQFLSRDSVRNNQDEEAQQEEAAIMELIRGFEDAMSSRAPMFTKSGTTVNWRDSSGIGHEAKTIGGGQCATVWQIYGENLAFRRYDRHSLRSAVQQAEVQKASNVIHEQLVNARDDQGRLRELVEIGLPMPMSILSSRVFSQFEILHSKDDHYTLFEMQPLILREELVEHFLEELIDTFGDDTATISIPLYHFQSDDAQRTGEEVQRSRTEIWTLIVEGILKQVLIASTNLKELNDQGQRLGIAIDPKVANYQVRFVQHRSSDNHDELVAYLANYDGYPPNLSLFNKENVLFEGGPLYSELDKYFKGFSFTKAFVDRSMSLTTLEKQALKILASVAAQTAKKDLNKQVLQFTLDIVNRWLREHNSEWDVDWTLDDIADYQKKSGRYHSTIRLYLLAAELGALINPDAYSIRSTEFPINDDQTDWLKNVRDRFSVHIMAFFHLDEVDKLEQFLMAILDYDFVSDINTVLDELPEDIAAIAWIAESLIEGEGSEFGRRLCADDFQAKLALNDAFSGYQDERNEPMKTNDYGSLYRVGESRSIPIAFEDVGVLAALAHPDHQLLVGLRGFARLPPTHISKSNGYIGAYPSDIVTMIQERNLGLHVVFEHQTRRSLLAGLYGTPEVRLVSLLRNVSQFYDEEQPSSVLQGLSRLLDEKNSSSGLTTDLLSRLLLGRTLIVIELDPLDRERFIIRMYKIVSEQEQQGGDVNLRLNVQTLGEDTLRELVREHSSGYYYIFSGDRVESNFILHADRRNEAAYQIENADPHISDVNHNSGTKPPPQRSMTGDIPAIRLENYRVAILSFIHQNGYVQLPVPPSDQHCLYHALTVMLGINEQRMTKEEVMRKLRFFLARLLLQNTLGTISEEAEMNLVSQLGDDALVDMLTELSIEEGRLGGPVYQNNDVWADYNMMLIAAVVFQIDIPFSFFNVHNLGDDANRVLMHAIARRNGTLQMLDAHELESAVRIVYGPGADHWEIVVPESLRDWIGPYVPWIQGQHNIPSPSRCMNQGVSRMNCVKGIEYIFEPSTAFPSI